MRAFVAGLVAGAAAVALAWWLSTAGTGDAPHAAEAPLPASRQSRADEKPAPLVAVPRRRVAEPTPAEAAAPADDAPFAPGEAWLRVGEGYVFGETAARPGDAAEGGDLICLDITDDVVSLRGVSGARMADLPLGAVGIPKDVAKVAGLVTDAADDLADDEVSLTGSARPSAPGVALVRSARGATYKVFAAEIVPDEEVVRRRVHVRFAEVPARRGGGLVALPDSSPAKDAPTLADLKQIVAVGAELAGDSFAHFLEGDYERLSVLPEELVLKDGKYVLVDEPLTTSIEFHGKSGLFAARGIAATGRVRIRNYTGVAVRGDMAGEFDVGSWCYIHISGNLTGKLPIESSATVVIDGDLVGEVEAASDTTLLLRGRLLGKLTIKSGHSSFWFQQYMERSAAEALAAGTSGNGLHLRRSDLAAGTYTDIPGWSRVDVGEDRWNVIAK